MTKKFTLNSNWNRKSNGKKLKKITKHIHHHTTNTLTNIANCNNFFFGKHIHKYTYNAPSNYMLNGEFCTVRSHTMPHSSIENVKEEWKKTRTYTWILSKYVYFTCKNCLLDGKMRMNWNETTIHVVWMNMLIS